MPLLTEIESAGDLLALIESRRAIGGKSYREMSADAGTAHASYWATATQGRDPKLTTALAYAQAVGLRIYVGSAE